MVFLIGMTTDPSQSTSPPWVCLGYPQACCLPVSSPESSLLQQCLHHHHLHLCNRSSIQLPMAIFADPVLIRCAPFSKSPVAPHPCHHLQHRLTFIIQSQSANTSSYPVRCMKVCSLSVPHSGYLQALAPLNFILILCTFTWLTPLSLHSQAKYQHLQAVSTNKNNRQWFSSHVSNF